MWYSYQYFFILPLLGSFKNYVKYKNLNFILFLRTPCINIILLHCITYRTNYPILYSLITERYLLLLVKGLYSYYTDNYNRKKLKYIQKYNINYTATD